MALYEFQSTFKDSLNSVKNNIFRGIFGDIAKQTLGIDIDNIIPSNENQVRIYFIDEQTNETLQLPVMPPEITLKWERKSETVNILNLGEVDFTTGKKLQEISFSSFFPIEYTSSYCQYVDIPLPREAYAQLDKWTAATGTDYVPTSPVRLVIVGTAFDINMLVQISSLEYKDKGGQPDDLYYSISCKEYREIKVRTEVESKQMLSRPDSQTQAKTVTQKIDMGAPMHETLYKVAKQELGDGAKWQEILNKNKKALQNDLTKAIRLVIR